MRRTANALVALLISVLAGTASAAETTAGQIVCGDLGEMSEFVKAIAADDKQWRDQLTTCVRSIPGRKIVIIDRNIFASGLQNVAKIRVFNAGGNKSGIVYAILES